MLGFVKSHFDLHEFTHKSPLIRVMKFNSCMSFLKTYFKYAYEMKLGSIHFQYHQNSPHKIISEQDNNHADI